MRIYLGYRGECKLIRISQGHRDYPKNKDPSSLACLVTGSDMERRVCASTDGTAE